MHKYLSEICKLFFAWTWCQPGFVCPLAGEQLGWGKRRQSRGLGLILSATGRVRSGREPANCRPAASHAGCQPLAPWAPVQLSAQTRTQPPPIPPVTACVSNREAEMERMKSMERNVCDVLWDVPVFRRWKEFLCKWATAFQLNVFARSGWWEKMLKNSNGVLHHILKLLRNVNKCDNVGEPRQLISRNKKKKKSFGKRHNSINFTFSTALWC